MLAWSRSPPPAARPAAAPVPARRARSPSPWPTRLRRRPGFAQFTRQTGIKVTWVNIGWDDLQTKIAAAASANTYFADAADDDWSKVGEYQKTGWFYPLNKYFDVASLRSDMPQLNTFISDNELMGMPFDSSFLVTTVNTKDFAKAGITTMPTTLAGFTAALKKVGTANGMASPLDIHFATAEGLSTCWYQLTAAFGGQVLTAQDAPAFTSPSSPGYQAMAWMVNAYKSGLVPRATSTRPTTRDSPPRWRGTGSPLRVSQVTTVKGDALDWVQESKDLDPDFGVILAAPIKKGETTTIKITYGGKDVVLSMGGCAPRRAR